MDFAAIATALFVALGLLGFDAVRHSDVVELQVVTAPSLTKSDRLALDQATLEQEFEFALVGIADTPSLIQTPLIHATQDEGVGMAVFAAIKMRHVAKAIQGEMGYASDTVRLTLFVEHGELQGLIHGVDRRVGIFRTTLVAGRNEPLIDFVHRCASWVAGQLAPYTTALYEMQNHANDHDFSRAMELIDHAKSVLPASPVSLDRSLFDNLLGLIALFHKDAVAARASFEQSIDEDAANPAPKLNVAFTYLLLGDYAQAVARMQQLTAELPSRDKILLSTAYVTWAAAEMGQHHLSEADALLAKATALNPDCAAAFELWAETRHAMGDADGAAAYRRQALIASQRFQNYGELATLYFQPAWDLGRPLIRSKYSNPTSVQLH